MSTLAQIETAADALPAEQKQELILFLATRLRGNASEALQPRRFSKEQMAGWLAEDEADLKRFQQGA